MTTIKIKNISNDESNPAYSWIISEYINKEKIHAIQSHYIIGSYKSVDIPYGKMLLVVHFPDEKFDETLSRLDMDDMMKELATLIYDCNKHDSPCFEDVGAILLLQILHEPDDPELPYRINLALWFDNETIDYQAKILRPNDIRTDEYVFENIKKIPRWKNATCINMLTPFQIFHIVTPTIIHSLNQMLCENDHDNVETLYCDEFDDDEKHRKIEQWYKGDVTQLCPSKIEKYLTEIAGYLHPIIHDNDKIIKVVNKLIPERGLLVMD